MPHKHRRKAESASNHDLPPTSFAKPLPVGKASTAGADAKPAKRKRKNDSVADDTPKAFKRLLEFQKNRKFPSGLDDGRPPPSKKRKRGEEAPAPKGDKEASNANAPRILPGERLSDFASRVNQAIPISGLTRKGKKIDGMQERQTRKEKKIQGMIAEWRRDEARLKDKEEEANDLADQEDAADFSVSGRMALSKRGRKKAGTGMEDDDDDDPWAKLKEMRGQKAKLHDVVQAPPDFKKLPTQKFKVKNNAMVDVANVPNAAGSLRRREELEGTRRSIIDSYRRLMEDKRSANGP